MQVTLNQLSGQALSWLILAQERVQSGAYLERTPLRPRSSPFVIAIRKLGIDLNPPKMRTIEPKGVPEPHELSERIAREQGITVRQTEDGRWLASSGQGSWRQRNQGAQSHNIEGADKHEAILRCYAHSQNGSDKLSVPRKLLDPQLINEQINAVRADSPSTDRPRVS